MTSTFFISVELYEYMYIMFVRDVCQLDNISLPYTSSRDIVRLSTDFFVFLAKHSLQTRYIISCF